VLNCTYAYYSGDVYVVGNYSRTVTVQAEGSEHRETVDLSEAMVGETNVAQYIRTAYASYGGASEASAVVFVPVAYQVTYVLDGGTNAEANPTVFSPNSGEIALADAVKDGADFGGWYLDEEYTTEVTSIDTTVPGDVTVYAKW